MPRARPTRRARERAASVRGRRRTSFDAGSRGGRRARWSSLDDLQVDVLEARGDDADAVELLARLDELAHDARHVLAARVGKAARSRRRLDLHPTLPAQLVG